MLIDIRLFVKRQQKAVSNWLNVNITNTKRLKKLEKEPPF